MGFVSKYTLKKSLLILIITSSALITILPFYLILINAFKSYSQIMLSFAGFPKSLNFNNFIKGFELMSFQRVMVNSIIITIFTISGHVIVSSMCAYWLDRHPSIFKKILFITIVASMAIPIQTVIIPLVKVIRFLRFANTYYGIILSHMGLGISFNLFLYHGFENCTNGN